MVAVGGPAPKALGMTLHVYSLNLGSRRLDVALKRALKLFARAPREERGHLIRGLSRATSLHLIEEGRLFATHVFGASMSSMSSIIYVYSQFF